MISFLTLAATATTTAAPAVAEGAASTDWTRALIQLAAIIFIFYLFFIRPQQKRAKEQMEMLSSLQVGDEVIVGGMIGKIVKLINDGEVLVEVADGVKVKVLRSFITKVMIEKAADKPVEKSKK